MLHPLTRRDLLGDNADLMEAAGALLAELTPRTLVATATPGTGGRVDLTVTTDAVSSVDVYLDGRPVSSIPTQDGTTHVDIPAPPAGGVVRLEGFDDNRLVASHHLTP